MQLYTLCPVDKVFNKILQLVTGTDILSLFFVTQLLGDMNSYLKTNAYYFEAAIDVNTIALCNILKPEAIQKQYFQNFRTLKLVNMPSNIDVLINGMHF